MGRHLDTLVVTSVGIDARTRAALRTTLQQNRFAELREGVWLRPDNLKIALPREVLSRVRVLHGYDDAPPNWPANCGICRAGHAPAGGCSTRWPPPPTFPGRFVAAAAMVRHLLTDPVLPAELVPRRWPGAPLRRPTRNSPPNWSARRNETELMEAK